MSKPHALDHVLSLAALPWALEPKMMRIAWAVLQRRLEAGPRPADRAEWHALAGDDDEPQPAIATGGGVGILPVHGVIAPRLNLLSDISGGATFEGIERALASALANDDVKTIVLDINSPGGSVFGARSCARAILAARAKKPVIAQVQHQGNSAAYWLASAATEVVAAPSAMVGSIGVFMIHDDISALLTKEGINRTLIAAGECKLDGNESQPLSERALARFKTLCTMNYEHFVADVAVGRGCTSDDVRTGFGQGDSVTAEEALELHMVDRIATLDDTLARFGASRLAAQPTAPIPLDAHTPQEPAKATGQDALSHQRALAAAVYALAIPTHERRPSC